MFFTPLQDANYCLFFFTFMVIDFGFCVLFLVGALAALVMGKDRRGKYLSAAGLFTMAMQFALMYFMMRIFYSMCTGSIQNSAQTNGATNMISTGGNPADVLRF